MESDKDSKELFVIHLRPLQGKAWLASPDQRLRRIMKALLRGYGFQCVGIRSELEKPEMPEHTGKEQDDL